MTIQSATIPNYDSAEQMVVMTIAWSSSCPSIPEGMWSHAWCLTTHSQLHPVARCPATSQEVKGEASREACKLLGWVFPTHAHFPDALCLCHIAHVCITAHHCQFTWHHLHTSSHPLQLTWNLHAYLCVPPIPMCHCLHTLTLIHLPWPSSASPHIPLQHPLPGCSHFPACGPGICIFLPASSLTLVVGSHKRNCIS